jgi:hypothetical protein
MLDQEGPPRTPASPASVVVASSPTYAKHTMCLRFAVPLLCGAHLHLRAPVLVGSSQHLAVVESQAFVVGLVASSDHVLQVSSKAPAGEKRASPVPALLDKRKVSAELTCGHRQPAHLAFLARSMRCCCWAE